MFDETSEVWLFGNDFHTDGDLIDKCPQLNLFGLRNGFIFNLNGSIEFLIYIFGLSLTSVRDDEALTAKFDNPITMRTVSTRYCNVSAFFIAISIT